MEQPPRHHRNADYLKRAHQVLKGAGLIVGGFSGDEARPEIEVEDHQLAEDFVGAVTKLTTEIHKLRERIVMLESKIDEHADIVEQHASILAENSEIIAEAMQDDGED